MSETPPKKPSTITLSRFFDKNARLVAGVCSKCYLEQKNDDVKITAVNRRFLKEVEKRKKLKCTTFLHDDYPCEGDSDYISRQTSENATDLKLPPTTTFANDDYTLITADTSRSSQIKPRLNYYNNNSACGNEVTNLCTKTENLLESRENDDCYNDVEIKLETRHNFITENIPNDASNLSELIIHTDSKTQNCLHVLDFNNQNSKDLDTHNSLTVQNCVNIKNSSVQNKEASKTIWNESFVEAGEKSKFLCEQRTQDSYTQSITNTQCANLINLTDAQDSSRCPEFHLPVQSQNYLNVQKISNFDTNVNFGSYSVCDSISVRHASFIESHADSLNTSKVVKSECSSQNNLNIKISSANNTNQNNKINLSKLSQKPEWLVATDRLKVKIEPNSLQDDYCNSTCLPIKIDSIKTEAKPSINFAKLKLKKNPLPEKSSWIPPRSPHNLIEESLSHDPWSLLIATIFLNKTSCMCARPRVEEFLKDFSGPLDVIKEHPAKLEKYFLDLGLHKKRGEQVWRMSYDYAYKVWKSPKELYGIGKYGEDAYRMFILGDLDIEPTDRFLKIYRDWARMKQKEDMNLAYPDND